MDHITITLGAAIAISYALGCLTGCAAFYWALREIIASNRECRDAVVNISERAMDRVHARHLHELNQPSPASVATGITEKKPDDSDKVFEDQLDAWAGRAALTTAAVPEKDDAE